MGTAMTNNDIELMGHLIRRAGFGATRDEIEQYAAHGYDATVDMLMDTGRPDGIQIDLIRRYHPDHSGGLGMSGFGAYWLHRMINSRTPLVEKVSLFWHGVFATGYSKLTQGKVLMDQIQMFRNHGFGDLRTLLIELSRDPSMIIWLDNNDNHNGAINENYGTRVAGTLLDGRRQLHRGRRQRGLSRLYRLDDRQHRVHEAQGGQRLALAVRPAEPPLRVPRLRPRRGRDYLSRTHGELQRRRHRRHHLRSAGDGPVHRAAHVQLLRGG